MFRLLFTSLLLLVNLAGASLDPIATERLFVLFDAGESTALLPVMQELENQGKDFRVLVMATAESRIPPDQFKGKRLTLEKLGIHEGIDASTPRTTKLTPYALSKLEHHLAPKSVIVGTASRIQRQICKLYRRHQATTFAYVDNFNYDPSHESYQTVRKVQAVAEHVLCPGHYVATLLQNDAYSNRRWRKYPRDYHIVGKPSLETWEKTITTLASQLDPPKKPVVTLIGGYGPGYDVIDPLFDKLENKLQALGYQVYHQRHPKVLAQRNEKASITTEQALAYTARANGIVVGYNSSVLFEAALLGIDALYFIPPEAPAFHHFAIRDGWIQQVTSIEMLLDSIQKRTLTQKPRNLRRILRIPSHSTQMILEAIN